MPCHNLVNIYDVNMRILGVRCNSDGLGYLYIGMSARYRRYLSKNAFCSKMYIASVILVVPKWAIYLLQVIKKTKKIKQT